MDRIKTFIKYGLAIIGGILLSELLINASLESQYRKLERRDNISQVIIQEAQATMVNARIKGKIENPEERPLEGKYLKFDFYSTRDVYMGTQYIDISNLEKNQTQDIEMYFRIERASYYQISMVDEKPESSKELDLLPKDLTKPEIIIGTIMALLIL